VSSVEGFQNRKFLGQFQIGNSVDNKIVFNDLSTGFNSFSNETSFSNVNVTGKLSINNSTTNLVTINNSNGENTITNKTTLTNDLNITDHQFIVKNGASNVITLNESVTGNNYFTGKLILSDNLNLISCKSITTTNGGTFTIRDLTTLLTLNLNTTPLNSNINLNGQNINLNGNLFINGYALGKGLINSGYYSQY